MDFATNYRTLRKPTTSSTSVAAESLEGKTGAVVTEILNAAVSFHKLHLKVKGVGSYAAHKALGDLYETLPGHADALAENFQGAREIILDCTEKSPKILHSVEDSLNYLRELYEMVAGLQAVMPYSEIVNDLDTLKSTINSAKYKLLFLS